MAKVNLYRNISITFIVFTALLITAVFLLFCSRTTVTVFTNEQDVDLNFVVELKQSPTADELAEKDMVQGQLSSEEKVLSGDFKVTTTKTVLADTVGKVEINNNSNKSQTLLKTTQLQAPNGSIVRTSQQVVVPANSKAMVEVYPKDPAVFQNIEPGNLVIIKLNPSLQSFIYGVNSEVLSTGPRQVKVLAESDINQSKEELLSKMIAENKESSGLNVKDGGLSYEVIKTETDKKVGDETDSFKLILTVKVKKLTMDQNQFLALVNRKIKNLNLTGLEAQGFDFTNLEYAVLDENFNGNVLARVNYSIKAKISANNPFLAKSNLVGKSISEAKKYLEDNDLIKKAEITVSPYWQKTLPKQEKKIKVIVQ